MKPKNTILQTKLEPKKPVFEYSEFCDINTTTKTKNIRMKNIVMDKFEVGIHNIDHRPVRESHVKKIISSYNGVDVPIIVAYSSKDGKYHVVDGQHRLVAVQRMIKNGQKEKMLRYPCLVLLRKYNGEIIDIANCDDANLVHKVSFSANEGSERTCVIDTIYRVWQIGQQYLFETKRKQGMYDYIIENLHSSRKYSQNTLEIYYNLADKLYNVRKDGLFLYEALDGRWDLPKIKDMLKSPKALKLYILKIPLSNKDVFDNIDPKLKRNYLHWNKYFLNQQTKINKDIMMVDEEP